jgi:hypothetical protein
MIIHGVTQKMFFRNITLEQLLGKEANNNPSSPGYGLILDRAPGKKGFASQPLQYTEQFMMYFLGAASPSYPVASDMFYYRFDTRIIETLNLARSIIISPVTK